ncbi:hypothetical protein [Pseudonocardia spirodelae]|uniref:Uncharacterized protein n=1 Tax=Pseudonocardia spirodelae TaxID=3133431 RepID=A0ABU8TA16_9PSEU
MPGRHRARRPARRRSLRETVLLAAPVVAAVAAAATVVGVVATAGLSADRVPAAAGGTAPVAGAVLAVPPPAARTVPLPATGPSTAAARAVGAALLAARICDLDGPPRFDDPADPDRITNRECGRTDAQGRTRSADPWIDAQLGY